MFWCRGGKNQCSRVIVYTVVYQHCWDFVIYCSDELILLFLIHCTFHFFCRKYVKYICLSRIIIYILIFVKFSDFVETVCSIFLILFNLSKTTILYTQRERERERERERVNIDLYASELFLVLYFVLLLDKEMLLLSN